MYYFKRCTWVFISFIAILQFSVKNRCNPLFQSFNRKVVKFFEVKVLFFSEKYKIFLSGRDRQH